MWIKQSDRKNLAEILAGNIDEASTGCRPSDSFPVDPIVGNDIYLIWDLDPKEKSALPSIIVVADEHLRDFLAWAMTYFPAYRPFTAYFRVLEFGTLAGLKNWFQTPCLNGLETACVGLMIGEALLLSSAPKKPLEIEPVACSTTISYVLARALALGANSKQLEFVCERWSEARQITQQPTRKLETGIVREIYLMLALLRSDGSDDQRLDSSVGVPKGVVEACSQLKNEGTISETTWGQLTSGVEELKGAPQKMEVTREERVRYFQRLLSDHSFSKLSDDTAQAFVCGYLGSLIGPGSLSHLDLVVRCVSESPSVLLWYGLCAGFHRKNELLTVYNVLGRRLLRELLRHEPLLAVPTADIAFSELHVLLEGNGKPLEFCTFRSNRVLVELLPCISIYLVWPKQETEQQMELFPKSIESTVRSDLLLDLGSLLRQAIDIQRLLVEPRGRNTTSQREPNRKTKKGGRKRPSGRK